MDDRILVLTEHFPEIFEKIHTPLTDLDKDWTIIDFDNDFEEETLLKREEDLLSDLDRFDPLEILPGDSLSNPDGHGIDGPLPAEFLKWFDYNEEPSLDRSDVIKIFLRPRPWDAFDRLRKKIKGIFPGSPAVAFDQNYPLPPPDVLAMYLPFHRYPEMWGIYLLDIGVDSFAKDLQAFGRLRGSSLSSFMFRRIAKEFLFHHEAYHSAVEGFALRCELPLGRPVYKKGLRKLFLAEFDEGYAHEETLATAYGIRKIKQKKWIPKSEIVVVVKTLCDYMKGCPPQYAAGVRILEDNSFDCYEREFMEEAIRGSAKRALVPEVWELGKYLMMPLLHRNKKYSWICNRNDFRNKSRLSLHYFRSKDVVSCIQKMADATIESGGKHLHIVRKTFIDGRETTRRTQIPSGDIHRGTLSGMLKDLDLRLNVERFRNACQKTGRSIS